ncbi:lipase family protein [Shewanella sedimentimangrovi]|uniref:Uncharacterized protein n=1 Tax=Shewanella sedimentimangrovi TaxID=2814293 RepID=A0ABX7R131_9GAMM|nr:hypothetical protein [Shewanella sedimentimangrovi]QSX36593.1 hypothetical protein JYB85_15080 [Shewanella sedimentimangrovi]
MKISNTLMLLGLFAVSPLSQAVTGLAFVHGTGKQTDALNDYWTSEFVNSVRQGLANSGNYTVINCDFDQYMWDEAASGCLVNQLGQFIDAKNIDSLILLTHSNGGNIVRWVLSNPTWDARYPKIVNATSRVIALAPSSAGTPLADAVSEGNVFETSLGWLLGYDSDAVKQQQVGWMSYYNSTWLYGTSGRPGLGKPFETVVGSDVDSAIWDSDSYCAGYQYQVALETTQNWLDSCSDGFLNCSSQSAAGTLWFTDKQKTAGAEPLSHQQSRRACFKLDSLIRNHI